jgi:hypothetical protein
VRTRRRLARDQRRSRPRKRAGALRAKFLATFVSSGTSGARIWVVPEPAFSARIAKAVHEEFSRNVFAKYTSELEYS